jgi:hypothetical protein
MMLMYCLQQLQLHSFRYVQDSSMIPTKCSGRADFECDNVRLLGAAAVGTRFFLQVWDNPDEAVRCILPTVLFPGTASPH